MLLVAQQNLNEHLNHNFELPQLGDPEFQKQYLHALPFDHEKLE